MTRQEIIKIIEKDKWMMDVLKLVESLDLPDSWIGAGFVRSKVWDHLHGYKKRTPLPDVDVIYFDPKAIPVEDEKRIWKILKEARPEMLWSVTNTAFRHLRVGVKPYKSSTDCLSHWSETATCVGVSLRDGKLFLAAPHGIYDLVHLIVRPTKDYKSDRTLFNKRVSEKEWFSKWPKLKMK